MYYGFIVSLLYVYHFSVSVQRHCLRFNLHIVMLDITWECSLLMALMPNQFKDMTFIILGDVECLVMGLRLQVSLGSM